MAESNGSTSPIAQLKSELETDPSNPRLLFMLGLEEIDARNWTAAVKAFEQVVALAPQVAAAHFNLGVSLFESDALDQSISAFETALQIHEDWDTLDGYGKALAADGRHDDAREIFQRAAALPELTSQQKAISLRNIAFTLVHAGDWDAATDFFQRAIGLHQSERNLECWFSSLNATGLASTTLERIQDLRIKSSFAELSSHLVVQESRSLQALGRHREALEKLIENTENPTDGNFLFSEIANLHLHLGHVSEALGCVHKIVNTNPKSNKWMSEWVRVLNLASSVSPERIFQNVKLWREQFAKADSPITIAARKENNVPNCDQRRISILVNADCGEVLKAQILPWLKGRSRELFHVTLVWDHWGRSRFEGPLRSLVDQWLSVALWRDNTLTKWCESQQIDLFLDCVGHGAKNRLAIALSHPARQHALWNFQQQTTGLAEMDYVIHDSIVASRIEKSFVSESVLVPEGIGFCASWLVDGLRNASEPNQITSNWIRFGFVGDLANVSPETLDLWAGVLAETANSVMVIRTPEFCCKRTVEETLCALSRRGCSASRIVAEELKIESDLANSFSDIDIFLDSAPANHFAGVSLALSLGIPIVSLAGKRPLELVTTVIQQRSTGRILLANSFEEYVQQAISLGEQLDLQGNRSFSRPPADRNCDLFDGRCYAKSIDELFYSISK